MTWAPIDISETCVKETKDNHDGDIKLLKRNMFIYRLNQMSNLFNYL